ncbi:hypothetical protein [Paenibacillus aestuarii]|uniref:Uncharacterized protein n=1 Tax=Paenibacillus aestuarii TaxID=516965 RepID=A0ABW0K6S4_9BACL|nr:hypothetical protein [Paenibacillus aestuarii]
MFIVKYTADPTKGFKPDSNNRPAKDEANGLQSVKLPTFIKVKEEISKQGVQKVNDKIHHGIGGAIHDVVEVKDMAPYRVVEHGGDCWAEQKNQCGLSFAKTFGHHGDDGVGNGDTAEHKPIV